MSTSTFLVTLASLLVLLPLFFHSASAHGLMSEPPQRGILAGNKFAPRLEPIPDAPKDFFAHFPAGDKASSPGAGKRSQEREANNVWTPFEPLDPAFKWRAGVCGDMKNNQEHLRGGKYYYDGMVTRTYRQGGIIEVGNAIVAHHNGFIELHICDVRRCDGEISASCFTSGACRMLERAPNPECDSGTSKKCAPIDSNYPGRWYLPCSAQNNDEGWDDYKPEYAKFKLPENLSCEHCVLHWFYTTASGCNPRGVVDYFTGPDGPKAWGNCPGQAGALGGFTNVQNECGEGRTDDQFAEEYYQCADIAIEGADGARSDPAPVSAPSPEATLPPTTSSDEDDDDVDPPMQEEPVPARATPTPESGMVEMSGSGVFKYFNFIADGEIVKSFTESLRVDISKYDRVAIEAVADRSVRPVDFYVDGSKVWDENSAPYFLWGNSKRSPRYYSEERLEEVLNREFSLEVRWESDSMKANVLMER